MIHAGRPLALTRGHVQPPMPHAGDPLSVLEFPLPLPEGDLRLLTVGDVRDRAVGTDKAAIAIMVEAGVDLAPAVTTIDGAISNLMPGARPLTREQPGELVLAASTVADPDEIKKFPAKARADGKAGHPGPCWIEVGPGSIGIRGKDDFGQALQNFGVRARDRAIGDEQRVAGLVVDIWGVQGQAYQLNTYGAEHILAPKVNSGVSKTRERHHVAQPWRDFVPLPEASSCCSWLLLVDWGLGRGIHDRGNRPSRPAAMQ